MQVAPTGHEGADLRNLEAHAFWRDGCAAYCAWPVLDVKPSGFADCFIFCAVWRIFFEANRPVYTA